MVVWLVVCGLVVGADGVSAVWCEVGAGLAKLKRTKVHALNFDNWVVSRDVAAKCCVSTTHQPIDSSTHRPIDPWIHRLIHAPSRSSSSPTASLAAAALLSARSCDFCTISRLASTTRTRTLSQWLVGGGSVRVRWWVGGLVEVVEAVWGCGGEWNQDVVTVAGWWR